MSQNASVRDVRPQAGVDGAARREWIIAASAIALSWSSECFGNQERSEVNSGPERPLRISGAGTVKLVHNDDYARGWQFGRKPLPRDRTANRA